MVGYLDPGTGSIVLQLLFLPLIVVVVVVVVVSFRRRSTAATDWLPPPPPTGRWYADPTGRFAQRWWTGSAWTDEVVLPSGQQTTDPNSLPYPPPAPPGSKA